MSEWRAGYFMGLGMGGCICGAVIGSEKGIVVLLASLALMACGALRKENVP